MLARLIVGLLRDGGDVVVLRDPTGKEINIPADQIASRQVSPVSLMPPGLTATLRRDEFVDLIRFLSELGKEGEFKVPRQSYVRRWRVADAGGTVGELLRRSGVNAAMLDNERIAWAPVYSQVDGTLPLGGLGISSGFQSRISLLRFEVEVASAGEFKLRVNDPAGLQVWSGEGTVDFVSGEAAIAAEVGTQTITVVIDRNVRTTALQIEVLDASAKAVPVGGI